MLRSAAIGEYVTFRDKHLATRVGRVVGTEDVESGDRFGRSAGRWLLVKCDTGGEFLHVKASAVGGILRPELA